MFAEKLKFFEIHNRIWIFETRSRDCLMELNCGRFSATTTADTNPVPTFFVILFHRPPYYALAVNMRKTCKIRTWQTLNRFYCLLEVTFINWFIKKLIWEKIILKLLFFDSIISKKKQGKIQNRKRIFTMNWRKFKFAVFLKIEVPKISFPIDFWKSSFLSQKAEIPETESLLQIPVSVIKILLKVFIRAKKRECLHNLINFSNWTRNY